MSNQPQIVESVSGALQDIDKIRIGMITEITQFFDALPENPKITRLGGSAYSINSKDMLNWSPFTNDFKAQYPLLRDLAINAVNKRETGEIRKILGGYAGAFGRGPTTHKDLKGNVYAKEVIEQCRPLLEKLVSAFHVEDAPIEQPDGEMQMG